jgi:signal peptidase I
MFSLSNLKSALKFTLWFPVGVLTWQQVVSVHKVEGTSMQPALNPKFPDEREAVLVNHLSDPVRGDVAIIWFVASFWIQTPFLTQDDRV